MPKIVGIHGIGQQVQDGYTLGQQWFLALKGGLRHANRRDLADALPEHDLSISFYGDLFRPKGAMGDARHYTQKDITSKTERELLFELYDGALLEEEKLGPPEAALGAGRDAVRKLGTYPPVQSMLNRVLASPAFSKRIPESLFIGNLKQVSKFMDDHASKDMVLGRVKEEVKDDTVIVIGHSLGSVVAYEYLCRCRPTGVKLLVTLGSPLGIRNVVFDRLSPPPINGHGVWPGTASTAWVNVADPHDIVAMRKELAPLFPPLDGASNGVDDRRVNNDDNPHGIGPYLTAAETGSAIAAAL